ncbi:MAG TPA: glucosaminidase domain-containing protein [Chitinophagaceae bacterium]|nr:glucosaminidase domain-containing protein [Chitinophagaceae bacterium]
MKISRVNIILLLLLSFNISFSQNAERIRDYINQYKDLAVSEMQRTGVPASITLAQGIHETMAGTSNLVQKSNNHFGIKCKSNWTGESVSHDDDAKGECFRKYQSAEESYRDHSDFLKNSNRYASLFSLDPNDYTGWAYGLKKAGYATNPKYPQVLIKLIEDYNLQDYTLIALEKKNNDAANTVAEEKKVENGGIETNEIKLVYPEGSFIINETKVVYVKKGTSFLAIAQQYSVPLSRIFEFNEIDQAESSDKDQLIFLQRKRKMGANEFHIVKPGEDLHDIAQSEAIRLENLKEYNWLRSDAKPAPGEKLYLQKKADKSPRLALRENYSLEPVNKIKTAN